MSSFRWYILDFLDLCGVTYYQVIHISLIYKSLQNASFRHFLILVSEGSDRQVRGGVFWGFVRTKVRLDQVHRVHSLLSGPGCISCSSLYPLSRPPWCHNHFFTFDPRSGGQGQLHHSPFHLTLPLMTSLKTHLQMKTFKCYFCLPNQ